MRGMGVERAGVLGCCGCVVVCKARGLQAPWVRMPPRSWVWASRARTSCLLRIQALWLHVRFHLFAIPLVLAIGLVAVFGWVHFVHLIILVLGFVVIGFGRGLGGSVSG